MTTREIKLENISFENLNEKLGEIQFDKNPLCIDMSYNRLGAACLPILFKWLSKHQEIKICVGFTNIGLSEICKSLLTEMGTLKWIIDGRISIGKSEEEHKLDIIRAQGFLEGHEISLMKANKFSKFDETMNVVSTAHENNMKELEKLTHDLTMMENNIKGLLSSTKIVTKWHQRITERNEVLITHIAKMYLERLNNNDIIEFPRKYNKIETLKDIFDRGVEWDGVLWDADNKYLYLVEAKTSLQLIDITNRDSRIALTLIFISLCRNGEIQKKS